MRTSALSHSLAFMTFAHAALGAVYSRTDSIVGDTFNTFFAYQAIDDPTHGFVNYVDQATAQSANLTFATDDTFILRGDYKTTLTATSTTNRKWASVSDMSASSSDSSTPSSSASSSSPASSSSISDASSAARSSAASTTFSASSSVSFSASSSAASPSATASGRNSVRLRSTKTYNTHVAIFNMRHMPEGCGTWPAVWEIGPNSPAGGEVDIVEGVNLQQDDFTTLHTEPGCTIPQTGTNQTGYVASTDCGSTTGDVGYHGCVIKATVPNSYGANFNSNGGGIYSLERTVDFIKVWFWANGITPPADVSSPGDSVDTDTWGTPHAFFPNNTCDYGKYFTDNNIIINLTFCGDWAGTDNYAASGCPSTCDAYVAENPAQFENAYFDFASINIYE